MKCSCCGGDADTVLETEASGVSFLCEICSNAVFMSMGTIVNNPIYISQGAAEPCD